MPRPCKFPIYSPSPPTYTYTPSILHFKLSSPHSHSYPKSHQHPNLHPHTRKSETIYTADFQIVPLTTQPANSDPSADPFPLSLLLTQSRPISETAPISQPISTAIVPPEPLDGNTSQDPKDMRAQATHKNGNRSWGRMETAKFRLLFMLWPALVGVSMAV